MKNVIFILIMLFPATGFLYAQTAAELEEILQIQTISYGQAARFVLEAADMASPKDTGAAFSFATERAWLSKKAAAEKPITLAELSFLIMKAFDIKGGMMYAILPGPRYAYRSMISRSFIQDAADPAMTVSGDRFLLILGNVLNYAGGELVAGGKR
ncbi:MAG: hypothetical protein LBB89_07420 [Treponema sp.]|nr:hypothetical protein [Treponema sp.]